MGGGISSLTHEPKRASEEGHPVFFLPESAFKGIDCKRDVEDARDYILDVAQHSKVRGGGLPAKMDLRPAEPFPIYSQGKIGSCTANALAAAFHFEQIRQGIKDFCPSRLFIYYNERYLSGQTRRDSGAGLRDGIKVLHSYGVCDEASWPYEEWKLTQRPEPECFEAAKANKIQQYARVEQTLDALRGCIASGFPFVFGFQIFIDFLGDEVKATGEMRFPPQGRPLGGHAVQACGYDDERRVFIIRNSWGEGWADKGHFYMPYDFILHPQLCNDFWVIRFVEGAEFPVAEKPPAAATLASKDVEPSGAPKAKIGGA